MESQCLCSFVCGFLSLLYCLDLFSVVDAIMCSPRPHCFSALPSPEIRIVCIACLVAVRDQEQPCCPCVSFMTVTYKDDRIDQVVARTFLHLDLSLPLCDVSSPTEDAESWEEHCSRPNNKRKPGHLQHDFF